MLTDIAIKAALREARTTQKPLKRFDQSGLFLLATPGGSGLWRFKFMFKGREKLISLGRFPDVPLKRAREKRDEARRQVADGVDPSAMRKAAKLAHADSVEAISGEWLDKQRDLQPGTIRRHRRRLEKFIFPYIGKRPIKAVTPPELLTHLRRIEALGKVPTAERTRQLCGEIWRYAIADGRAERDISADLRGALARAVVTNHAALTNPAQVGELLRAIDGYVGQAVTRFALKFAPLTFVRPGELRRAEWSEFDIEAEQPVWRIPAEKMKMRDSHLVPLSRQAAAILRDLALHTGGGKYVFPSLRSGGRPMSENTVNAALRRLGYANDEMTGHGFRSTASTMLNELGFHPDLIELQLAHKERNKSRASYNKALRIEERTRMMQSWADRLDMVRAGGAGKVVPIKRAAATA
jgi:integrase